jgi:hypothetical protein
LTDKLFLQHLVEIKTQVRLNTQLLQSQTNLLQELQAAVANRSINNSTREIPQVPAGITLPMSTVQHVHQLEKTLRTSPVDRKKLVNFV